MILEVAFSISLSFDNYLKCVKFNNESRYASQITMESVERYQFTTKDINPNPYDYMKNKNQQLLDYQMIEQLDLDSTILQDEE